MKPLLTSTLVGLFASASMAHAATFQDESLTFSLLKRMDVTRNQVFSPYSISSAFALLALGARGETRKEMSAVFGFGADDSALLQSLENQHKSFTDTQGFSTASEIWFATRLKLRSDYKASLDRLKTPLMEADFATEDGRDQAARDINSFASSSTNGKIGQIVSSDAITPDLKMVLVNAVAFTGKWKNVFNPARTKKENFQTPKTTVQVPFMHQQGEFAYTAIEKKFQIAALPYDDDRLSMILVLPEKGLSLTTALDELKLASILPKLRKRTVNVSMPKFKFTSDHPEMAADLKAVGLKSAFDANADFSGLFEKKTPAVAVSKLIHKALIEVDEKGTEAAAATAVKVGTLAFKPKVDFKLDRPFLFMIHDSQTNRLLFAGWIVRP
jgi:serpin B